MNNYKMSLEYLLEESQHVKYSALIFQFCKLLILYRHYLHLWSPIKKNLTIYQYAHKSSAGIKYCIFTQIIREFTDELLSLFTLSAFDISCTVLTAGKIHDVFIKGIMPPGIKI